MKKEDIVNIQEGNIYFKEYIRILDKFNQLLNYAEVDFVNCYGKKNKDKELINYFKGQVIILKTLESFMCVNQKCMKDYLSYHIQQQCKGGK